MKFLSRTRNTVFQKNIILLFIDLQPTQAMDLILYLYSITYSVICRPSDHTVGRPWVEIQTPDGRSRCRALTIRPPHLLIYVYQSDGGEGAIDSPIPTPMLNIAQPQAKKYGFAENLAASRQEFVFVFIFQVCAGLRYIENMTFF